jgi:hypothetical protein
MEAGDTVFFHPLLIHGRCSACVQLHLHAFSLRFFRFVLFLLTTLMQWRQHYKGLSQSHFLSLRFL